MAVFRIEKTKDYTVMSVASRAGWPQLRLTEWPRMLAS